MVTSIDWAPKSNRIVTCAQDRNAYVWTYKNNSWSPSLVLLRINRSATFVRWAPNEEKFAVASGAKCVSVCYFEAEHDWWVSKHLRKSLKSTILTLAWHPDSVLLAIGGTDCHARVFSGYIKDIDKKPESKWGDNLSFGQLLADVFCDVGWIHCIQFSEDGNSILYATHGSCFVEYNVAKEQKVTELPTLPFISFEIINGDIIAGGHDCSPAVLRKSKEWKFQGLLNSATIQSKSGANSALAKFRALDSKATTIKDTLSTVHQSTIRSIRIHHKNGFSSSGSDGRLVVWDTLSQEFKNLQI